MRLKYELSTINSRKAPAQLKGNDIMPVYQDGSSKTWYCKFYYQDYTGERKQKKKRGFKLQREAKEWERSFLEKQQGSTDMIFSDFATHYLDEMGPRLKESTLINKRLVIQLKLIPTFGNIPLQQIKPQTVLKWQNQLIQYKDKDGISYSQTYLNGINNELNAIFNYAVRFYGLTENPCKKIGKMGKTRAKEMDFWTLDEFKKFIKYVKNPQARMAFMVLYWCGIRSGEMFALTADDIDFSNNTMKISKTMHRINKKIITTSPKTENSNRCVQLSSTLAEQLKDYIKMYYSMSGSDYLFPFTKFVLYKERNIACEKSELKRIRVHDLRHSHVSLLIDMGYSSHLIAERIGDTVQMVDKTYGHLYPNRHKEMADVLNSLI